MVYLALLSHIITSRYDTSNGQAVDHIRVVLVKFDSDRVGKAARANSAFKKIDENAVPIFG